MGAGRDSRRRAAALVATAALALLSLPHPATATPPPIGSACTITGTPAGDVIVGTPANDVVCGLGGDDTITGLGGDDLLLGGPGDDTLDGGDGDDDLRGGPGVSTLLGGNGADRLYGGALVDHLDGGPGDDRLIGAAGADVLAGGDGGDIVLGKAGGDQLTGGPGIDYLHGGTEDDDVRGDQGNDRLFGDAGDDEVRGGDDADIVRGGLGNDELFGEAGNDQFFDRDGAPYSDAAHCGDGRDTATLDARDVADSDCEDRRMLDRAPVAVDDTATVTEDAVATAIDVLANDTDADGGPKVVGSVVQPAHGTVVITGSGTGLTYQPAPDFCTAPGAADTFTYALSPGGDSGSVSVAVACVRDPAVAVDDAPIVLEDVATTIDVLANDQAGDAGALSVSTVTQPPTGTAAVTDGGAAVRYTPPADYCNNPPGTNLDRFTYTLSPDGDTARVDVTVACANDGPMADDESFTGSAAAVGNTVLVVDDPTDGAPEVVAPHKTISGDLLAGDVDPDGDVLSVVPGTVGSNDGGTATLQADGDFVYTPAAGTSCIDTSDSFVYTVTDGQASDEGTVTIATTGCVWYVSNNAAGNAGTSVAPFDTLAQAQSSSFTGNTIYVFYGDGTSSGYDQGIYLKSGQRLLGEAADLRVGSDLLSTGVPARRPILTDEASDVVELASGVVVQGIQVDPLGGAGLSGFSATSGTIADVRVIDRGTAGRAGLSLVSGGFGTWSVSDLVVDNTAATGATSSSTGIYLDRAGTVTFADAGTISVRTKGAAAFDVTSTDLGTSVVDDVDVTGSTSGGIALRSGGGSVRFTNLSLATISGASPAFLVSSGGSVTVPASGTASVSAVGGPAVSVSGSTPPSLDFDSVSSTGSSSTGVLFSSSGAARFSAATGLIAGAVDAAFDVQGGSGPVYYGGDIANGPGPWSVSVTGRTGGTVELAGTIDDTNDAGGGVRVASSSGGVTTLSGRSKTIRTSTSDALSITSSDGHTVQSTNGGLVLEAFGGGRGISAVNSGTISVSGPGNTINTISGGAVNVVATDIGADDLVLRSVTSSGASTPIVLDHTGPSGSLVVTGNAGTCTQGSWWTCTGGSLSNSRVAVTLTSTTAPSFAKLSIRGSSDNAITGNDVVGFSLSGSVLDGYLGNFTDEGAISLTELAGPASITSSYVGAGYSFDLVVTNAAATLDRLTITDVTFGPGPRGDAVSLRSLPGAGDLKASIAGSSFTGAQGDLLVYSHQSYARGDLLLLGNAFADGAAIIAADGGGVSLFSAGWSDATSFSASNNTFQGAQGHAFEAVKGAGSSTQDGVFAMNTVGVAGTTRSGSFTGSAVRLQSAGGGSTTWAVTDNLLRQVEVAGVDLEAGDTTGEGRQDGTVDVHVDGNLITDAFATADVGIRLDIGTGDRDSFVACADVQDNAVQPMIEVHQRNLTTVGLPGYGGPPDGDAAVETYLSSRNNGAAALATDSVEAGGGGFVAIGACASPSVP